MATTPRQDAEALVVANISQLTDAELAQAREPIIRKQLSASLPTAYPIGTRYTDRDGKTYRVTAHSGNNAVLTPDVPITIEIAAEQLKSLGLI